MSKCRKCGVDVLDDTEYCPLCRGALDRSDGDTPVVRFNDYPDVITTLHRFSLVKRILFFIAVVVSLLAAYVNFEYAKRPLWSVVVIYAVFFIFFTFCRFINERYQVFTKISLTVFWGLIYTVVIDAVFGFTRWSINYVLPGAIFLIDVVRSHSHYSDADGCCDIGCCLPGGLPVICHPLPRNIDPGRPGGVDGTAAQISSVKRLW